MNCKKQLAKANTKHVEMNIYSLKLLFATGLQSNSNVNWDLLAFFPQKASYHSYIIIVSIL